MNPLATPDGIHPRRPQSLFGRAYRKVQKLIRQSTRRQLRRRVAFTQPSPEANQEVGFSPHCLTCHQDLLLAVCSAKSLNLAIERALPWVFHDDGSLTAEDKQLLHSQFPGCHLVERAEADHFFKVPELVTVARAREQSVLLLKLADLHVFARQERILFVDSDVLFFKRPDALFHVLESEKGNYFTKDLQTAYISDLITLEKLTGIRPLDRVNSGIFAVNRSDISLKKLSRRLSELDSAKQPKGTVYHHLIEQTLFAVLTSDSSGGAAHLPPDYDLRLERGLDGAVCRHYVGVIRDFFELEGLRALLSEADFLTRWQAFCNRQRLTKPPLSPGYHEKLRPKSGA